jgi:hypothetical protein
MLTPAEMTEYSTKTWMGLSNSPQLEEWLSPRQSDCDKDRLGVIGNIVVPQMGYFAANMLAQAWKAWTSHAQCAPCSFSKRVISTVKLPIQFELY